MLTKFDTSWLTYKENIRFPVNETNSDNSGIREASSEFGIAILTLTYASTERGHDRLIAVS